MAYSICGGSRSHSGRAGNFCTSVFWILYFALRVFMRSAFCFSRAAFFSSFDTFLAGALASGFQRFSCLLTGSAISSSHALYLPLSSETTFGCFAARSVISLRSFSRSKSSRRRFLCDQFPIPAANGPLSIGTRRTPVQFIVEFLGFAFEGGQDALTVQRFVLGHGKPGGVESRGKQISRPHGNVALLPAFQLGRPRHNERDMNSAFVVHLLEAAKRCIVGVHGTWNRHCP